MIEIQNQDLFKPTNDVNAICITTNGIIKLDGHAVMGKGVALQAKKLWPNISLILAVHLRTRGNMVGYLGKFPFRNGIECAVVSFPTKNNWRDPSDILLIKQSAEQLVSIADIHKFKKVWLTKPGCGNGGLQWSTVAQLISPILDDRFVVL